MVDLMATTGDRRWSTNSKRTIRSGRITRILANFMKATTSKLTDKLIKLLRKHGDLPVEIVDSEGRSIPLALGNVFRERTEGRQGRPTLVVYSDDIAVLNRAVAITTD